MFFSSAHSHFFILKPNPDKPEPKVESKRHLSQSRKVRKEGQGLILVLKPTNRR
jgi:hypothetical protein